MKSLFLSLAVTGVLLVAADATAQCKTYDSAFSAAFRDDANADLQDYGRIHADADGTNPECHLNAMYALEDKVAAHLAARPTTFQRWLDGYLVATIFAAAQRLGANGYATKDLDTQMAALETRFKHFVPTPGDPHPSGGCGGDALNTCMDDFMGTASAYAWMAAYQKKRPNRVSQATVDTNIANAKLYLEKGVGRVTGTGDDQHGVCIRNKPVNSGSMVPLCNADVTALINGTAETFSVNGSNQMIHYGFGLLTSVASTTIGIEVAGGSVDFTTNNKKPIINGLFEEAQRHINSGEFNSDCYGTNPTTTTMSPCGFPYRANMYALSAFYKKYIDPTLPSAGTYTSNSFDSGLFDLDSNENGFFSYGRYETYAKHGNTWVGTATVPRPEMMAGDSHDPVGFFEGISATGVAQGWTCDRDVPLKRVQVDFYVDGAPTVRVATGYADSASDTTIRDACFGGMAHRFWIQLPPATQGAKIHAFGLDYTWYGNPELGCLQSPQCAW